MRVLYSVVTMTLATAIAGGGSLLFLPIQFLQTGCILVGMPLIQANALLSGDGVLRALALVVLGICVAGWP